MFIDPTNGTVTLPIGFVIDADLTQDAFRSTRLGTTARDWDCGTLPFMHYSFSGGTVEEHELLASLCFYDQDLLKLSLTVNLYPPEHQGDWAHYSLQVEAETKVLHERILTRVLGKPTSQLSLSNSKPQEFAVLDCAIWWTYRWGTIGSHYDSKGGGTFIAIKYGDREEKANAAYRKLKR